MHVSYDHRLSSRLFGTSNVGIISPISESSNQMRWEETRPRASKVPDPIASREKKKKKEKSKIHSSDGGEVGAHSRRASLSGHEEPTPSLPDLSFLRNKDADFRQTAPRGDLPDPDGGMHVDGHGQSRPDVEPPGGVVVADASAR